MKLQYGVSDTIRFIKVKLNKYRSKISTNGKIYKVEFLKIFMTYICIQNFNNFMIFNSIVKYLWNILKTLITYIAFIMMKKYNIVENVKSFRETIA